MKRKMLVVPDNDGAVNGSSLAAGASGALRYFALISLIVCAGCGHVRDHQFVLVAGSGIDFENALVPNDSFNILNYEYFYNGAGVGVGDFNNDGYQDLFFAGNQVSSRLYLNRGDWSFLDVTDSFRVTTDRWVMGVSVVDINADGWDDIYLSCAGPGPGGHRRNLLFINSGKGFFEEQSAAFGLDIGGHSTQAVFLDYDHDGDPDLFQMNHSSNDRDHAVITPPLNDGSSLSNDRLLRNDGGKFTDVTLAAGIKYEGYGLGVSVLDINLDSWPDLYVANDYLFNDVLYINNGDGTFSNRLSHYFSKTSHFSMGMDVGDVNNDGIHDLMAVDMLPAEDYRQKMLSGPMNYYRYQLAQRLGYSPQFMRNTLQVGRNSGLSSELAFFAGVAATDWSWSVLLEDFDRDADQDIFITNGYVRNITDRDFGAYAFAQRGGRFVEGTKQENLIRALESLESSPLVNVFFENEGGFTFEDVGKEWVVEGPGFSSGAAVADFDNDGDLDIAVNNINQKPYLYKNLSSGGNYISVGLEGLGANPKATGATVILKLCDGRKLVKTRTSERGYLSSSSSKLHFGLGTCTSAALTVIWPTGKRSSIEVTQVNRHLVLQEPDQQTPVRSGDPERGLFHLEELPVRHVENEFNDFNFQPNLPLILSKNGPAIAVGDLDRDGLDDWVMGGAKGTATRIFFGKGEGEVMELPHVDFEDQGILIFDANGDGWEDIYVASGGYEDFPGANVLQDRLYISKKGIRFQYAPDALPALKMTSSVVRGADYDGDGDLDLFVGGDFYPKKYPLSSPSVLLKNEGGVFREANVDDAPELDQLGNVKTALWTDWDNDNDPDLIVAGFFEDVVLFENRNGRLARFPVPDLEQLSGWWLSLAGGDVDLDGDTDYLIGNWGTNGFHSPSVNEPITTYVSDFDKNGMQDMVSAYTRAGTEYPIAQRDMLIRELPQVKKVFPDYRSYANADLGKLSLDLKDALKFRLTEFRSLLLRNEGDGRFQVEYLPPAAQQGPVTGFMLADFNGDGWDDVLCGGGWEATEVVHGPQDAMPGIVFWNDQGAFSASNSSSIGINGSVKAMVRIDGRTDRILIGRNLNNPLLIEPSARFKRVKVTDGTSKYHYKVNGRSTFRELYYGEGHLSQSSRVLWLPIDAVQEAGDR